MTDVQEARPASTVVLLRDTDNGLETLMLKRNKALMFAGGLWVFPGGSLDAEDLDKAGGDVEIAARIAAAREAEEESGLQPREEDMVLLSHWTTPVAEPRRFSTWIYAAPIAADLEVRIDGGEIHDSQWMSVREAAAAHERGELGMLPPTYITLCNLTAYDNVAAMVDVERHSDVPEVFPVFVADGEHVAAVFRGDAEYVGVEANPGARHRAVLKNDVWEYVYEGVDSAFPPLKSIDP
jgi:8-oxo-dGTP pyrophosphatase MutT (NUDIX family)